MRPRFELLTPIFVAFLWANLESHAEPVDADAIEASLDAEGDAAEGAKPSSENAGDEPADDDATAADPPEELALIEISGSFELGYENVVAADDPDARISDAFLAIEADILVNLSETARLGTVLVFEPVRDPGPGEDRLFEDAGLFVEELYAGFDVGPATVQLGKMAPTFGWAADDAPGLYGGKFAGDYELIEQLGVNARISLSETPVGSGGATLEHVLHAALFTADRSLLSDSLFTGRGDGETREDGVGDTEAPQSFGIAYAYQTRDAEDEIAGPSLLAGIRRLAPDDNDAHAEWGFVGAFEDRFALAEDLALLPIVEAAYFIHSSGTDEAAWALTVGAELAKGAWRASSVYAAHDVVDDGLGVDHGFAADIGRIFDVPRLGEFRADIAYFYAREEEQASHTIGFQIEKEFDLSFR